MVVMENHVQYMDQGIHHNATISNEDKYNTLKSLDLSSCHELYKKILA